MNYTKEAIRAARQKDLVHWLQSNGYMMKKKGKDWALEDRNSLLVRENRWKDFYTGQGGNTLDFLIEIEGMNFSEAMEALGIDGGRGSQAARVARGYVQERKSFNVPEKNHDFRRVVAYLTKTRGIHMGTVKTLIKEGLLWQDQRGNCVFPLRNMEGKITGAILRGTLSNRRWVGTSPNSVNELGWHWPGTESALVFVEAPIEAMSLKQLRPSFSRFGFVALGGLHFNVFVKAIEHIQPEHIIIALNSDLKAREASKILRGWLQEQSRPFNIIFPISNDWNDDLIDQKRRETYNEFS
ncbi:DUF3991 domain-containing protein [Aminobacterium colombiense]|jgi:hypothetical protein|uniref:DUF3991 domain-containing protein n=1 Tax=Aminobacterium colombiense TaxID=81468 RepID=UPI002597AD70|nr:DUF3991 domain-containing protein [uncultured Aminobacterium sp.]